MKGKGNAYDLLKFFMALLIVAIHTKAFYAAEFSSLNSLTSLAVPGFFILSSLFYFKKLRAEGSSWHKLKHFLSRMCFFYLFWFIINIPFIEMQHHYFIEGGVNDIWRLFMDIVFRYTFNGSWFLSSLVLAVVLLTLCYKYRLTRIVMTTFSILLLFYNHCINQIPEEYRLFYNWWATTIRPEVSLTVLESLPWVAIGLCLSSEKVDKLTQRWIKNRRQPVLFVLFGMSLILYLTNTDPDNSFLLVCIHLLTMILLILLTGTLPWKPSSVFMRLRKLSILFYVMHFIFLNVMFIIVNRLFHKEDVWCIFENLTVYFITLTLCLIFSDVFLRLSGKKYFTWLKYGY